MGYLGDEVKKLKRINGMTSKVLASRAGVSLALIEQICAGNRAPSVKILLSIARALSAEPHSLICAKMADELDKSLLPGDEFYEDALKSAERFMLWSGLQGSVQLGSPLARATPQSGMRELLDAGLCLLRFSERSSGKNSVYSADFVLNSEQKEATGGICLIDGSIQRIESEIR